MRPAKVWNIQLVLLLILAATGSAATPDQPLLPAPKSSLSGPDLQAALAELDRALASSDWEVRDAIVSRFVQGVEKNYFHNSARVLRYSNSEIQQKIVDLYLSEMEKSTAPLPADKNQTTQSTTISENPQECFEGFGEYEHYLATLAQSTCSPRIYDSVLLEKRFLGDLWTYYLASVNPEDSLQALFDSKLGDGPSPDGFYRQGRAIFDIEDAFPFLWQYTRLNPVLAAGHHDAIMAFISKHALHFAQAQHERKFDFRDYVIRRFALDIIRLIGKPQDLEIINMLQQDAPVIPAKLLSRWRYDSGRIVDDQISVIAPQIEQAILSSGGMNGVGE